MKVTVLKKPTSASGPKKTLNANCDDHMPTISLQDQMSKIMPISGEIDQTMTLETPDFNKRPYVTI